VTSDDVIMLPRCTYQTAVDCRMPLLDTSRRHNRLDDNDDDDDDDL